MEMNPLTLLRTAYKIIGISLDGEITKQEVVDVLKEFTPDKVDEIMDEILEAFEDKVLTLDEVKDILKLLLK